MRVEASHRSPLLPGLKQMARTIRFVICCSHWLFRVTSKGWKAQVYRAATCFRGSLGVLRDFTVCGLCGTGGFESSGFLQSVWCWTTSVGYREPPRARTTLRSLSPTIWHDCAVARDFLLYVIHGLFASEVSCRPGLLNILDLRREQRKGEQSMYMSICADQFCARQSTNWDPLYVYLYNSFVYCSLFTRNTIIRNIIIHHSVHLISSLYYVCKLNYMGQMMFFWGCCY